MAVPRYKVGDKVEATSRIMRTDRRAVMKAGDTAEVVGVYEFGEHKMQDLSLEIDDNRGHMAVLILDEKTPLKKL